MVKLKDKNRGDLIRFAGMQWMVLEPLTGYVFCTQSIATLPYYKDSTITSFRSDLEGHVAHYLNNTFYNSLSTSEKNMIKTANWYYQGEGYSQGTGEFEVAKVGLLSYWDIETYEHRNGRYKILPRSDVAYWTLSKVSNSSYRYQVWRVIDNNLNRGDGSVVNSSNTHQVKPAVYLDPNLDVAVNGVVSYNKVPTITITSPTANQTLHENSTLTLAGNTTDTDIDNVVTIKYQIDSGAVRNLASGVSDGSTPIDFSKSFTYKDGTLYDGATAITSVLDKDTPHTVSIWAEDDKGGKSSIITRTFFVVPNRPPSVAINPIGQQTDLINSNVINVNGVVTDADKNDVTVTFSINGGEEQQVYQGPPSSFTFNILLADLKVGANTVIVKATDIYNTSGTKTLTINKTHNAVPVNKAVARYAIQAPTGTAKSVLLWITRTLGNLGITAEVSLTNTGEAENYVELDKTNSAVVNGLKEEEYAYQGTVDKEKIVLKITYDRMDATVIDTIKQISGVLF